MHRPDARSRDDEDADKPDADGRHAPPADPLAEERTGEQRHQQRRREDDRLVVSTSWRYCRAKKLQIVEVKRRQGAQELQPEPAGPQDSGLVPRIDDQKVSRAAAM